MISTLNRLLGTLIRLASLLIIQFNTRLKSSYLIVKNDIKSTLGRENTVSNNLLFAIIQIEDRRYYSHHGIDFYAISRAIVKNLTKKKIEGASTIAQQLVRGITGERELKVKRKIREIIIASLISKDFSKHDILIAYVNLYQFRGCKGVFELCKKKNLNIYNLTTNESAQIAARFKYPILTTKNYVKYLKRVREIEIQTLQHHVTMNIFEINKKTVNLIK